MDGITPFSLIVSVFLALCGFLFKYFHSKRLEGNRNRLERINQQLNEFYGPFLAVVQANQKAWDSLIDRYGGDQDFYKEAQRPNEEKLKDFQNWMEMIFIPNNEKLYDIIIHKTSLIHEKTIPQELLDLIAHLLEFKIKIAQWQKSDKGLPPSKNKYPGKKLLDYSKQHFNLLKEEQNKLIKVD